MIRAVIDANIVFSATIIARGIPYQLLLAWREQRYVLISSSELIGELEENLRDPKQAGRYNLSDQDIQSILSLLRTASELIVVPPSEVRVVTGDPEDDHVLALTRLAQADYLVTGDRGLLALGRYEGIPIIPPRQFAELLEQQGSQDKP